MQCWRPFCVILRDDLTSFPGHRNNLHRTPTQNRLLGVADCVHRTSLKELWFCRAQFQSYINLLHWVENVGQLLEGFSFYSYNLAVETNNFGLDAFLLPGTVSELHDHLHRDSNSGQLLGVSAFVPVIYLSTQATLILAQQGRLSGS